MIIFLDIDGVLATNKSYVDHPFYQWDPDAVAAFYRLYAKIGSTGVVISSDWRYLRSMDWFESAFTHYKAKDVVLLGCTEMDEAPDDENPLIIGDLGLNRGQKILKWMDDHDYSGDYVVIDDTLPIIKDHIPEDHIIWVKDGFDTKALTDAHVDAFLASRS